SVSLGVADLRGGSEDVLPARPAQAIAQIHVLHVHEVALIEAADRLEGLPPQQQAGAGEPARLALAVQVIVVAVLLRPWVGRPHPAQQGVTDAGSQARDAARARVGGTVGFADQRADRTRTRVATGTFQHRVDGARGEDDIWAGDDEELIVDLARVAQVAEVAGAEVHRGAVANVATRIAQLQAQLFRLSGCVRGCVLELSPRSAHASVTVGDGSLRSAVRRTVVDHDDVRPLRGGSGDGVQELCEVLAGRIRHRDNRYGCHGGHVTPEPPAVRPATRAAGRAGPPPNSVCPGTPRPVGAPGLGTPRWGFGSRGPGRGRWRRRLWRRTPPSS